MNTTVVDEIKGLLATHDQIGFAVAREIHWIVSDNIGQVESMVVGDSIESPEFELDEREDTLHIDEFLSMETKNTLDTMGIIKIFNDNWIVEHTPDECPCCCADLFKFNG